MASKKQLSMLIMEDDSLGGSLRKEASHAIARILSAIIVERRGTQSMIVMHGKESRKRRKRMQRRMTMDQQMMIEKGKQKLRKSMQLPLILVTLRYFSCHAYWILDSGASFHVTPHRDWFSTYDSGMHGCVHLGNNYACDILGAGDIKVSFANGSSFTLDTRGIKRDRKSVV